MSATIFDIKKIKAKGRRVSFTIVADGLELEHRISVSMKLSRVLNKMNSSKSTDEEKMEHFQDVCDTLIGEVNYDKIVDWLEDNVETLEEEQEAVGQLISVIVDKAFPKVQSSAQKE